MMTKLTYTLKCKKTLLSSVVGLILSQSTFALEQLSDESLSATTGEGVAFLPTQTYFVLQDQNSTAADLTDRTKDTGYIHIIPVGPLTSTVTSQGAGKADVYVYGLALSKSDNNSNARLAPTGSAAISSWGTASNPWILKVETENNVPTFSPDSYDASGNRVVNTETKSVPYVTIEAPLYEDGNKDSAGLDAYKLKLGMWTDIFKRNPNVVEGTTTSTTGKNAKDAGLDARLRLQAVWNNFSVNGSRIQVFQTLNGATNSKGMSSFYNNTLGIAGLIRLNSGDAANLKAVTTVTRSVSTPSAWTTIHDASNADFSATNSAGTGASCNNGTQSSAPNYGAAGCQYYVQKRTATETATTTLTAPLVNNVLRLSTRETSNTTNLDTPAINGGVAPSFDPNEGLYIYNLNMNLVLGSSAQPLILGSDGKNFSIELARIPDKESVYKKIYTNYNDSNVATNGGYSGSTCNIYQCGTSAISGYQGSNATHSSITIGSTIYDKTNNRLTAYTGADAIGISFGPLTGTSSKSATQTLTETQYMQRQQSGSLGTWCTYNVDVSWCASGSVKNQYDWVYNNGSGTYVAKDRQTTPSNGSSEDKGYPTVSNRTFIGSGAGYIAGTGNSAIENLTGIKSVNINNYTSSNQTLAAPVPTSFSNNLGSAVIDGVLIQHLKITTKGL